jgi:DNA-binding PadR family transcriptional regulator
MPRKTFLGEFEQMVLLAILQRKDEAFSLGIRQELERRAGRKVSRGAFYATLDRLEAKGFVRWKEEAPTNGRGGLPQRRFTVTAAGVRALRTSRSALRNLWQGLETVLGE